MSPASVPVPTHPPQRDDPAYDRNHDDHVAQSIHETRLVQRASGPNHPHRGVGKVVKLECICFTSFYGLHIGYISLGGGGGSGLVNLVYIYTSIQFVFIIQTGSRVFDTCVFWPKMDSGRSTDSIRRTASLDRCTKADDFIAEQRAAMLCRAGSVGLGRSTTYTVWSRPLTAASSRGICRDSRVGVVDVSLWVVTVVFHW